MKKLIFVGLLVAISLVAFAVITRSDSQAYCSVRFGSAETTETIFGCDRNSLLVYRNNDLALKPEAYPMAEGKLIVDTVIPPFKAEGKVYTVTQCYHHIEMEPSRRSLMIHVSVTDGETQFKQYCDVTASPNREQLCIAHFDGPLSIEPQAFNWVTIKKPLVIGGEPTDLRVVVGSFDQTAGCWTVVESGTNEIYNFPDDVVPVATVAFPSGDPDSPIVERFYLNQFC